jgi:hypothetical protein
MGYPVELWRWSLGLERAARRLQNIYEDLTSRRFSGRKHSPEKTRGHTPTPAPINVGSRSWFGAVDGTGRRALSRRPNSGLCILKTRCARTLAAAPRNCSRATRFWGFTRASGLRNSYNPSPFPTHLPRICEEQNPGGSGRIALAAHLPLLYTLYRSDRILSNGQPTDPRLVVTRGLLLLLRT